MPEFFSKLFVDICLVGGVLQFFISLKKMFKERRRIMMAVSVILIVVGLIFLDTGALSEAYQRGAEAAGSMMAE